ncbi:MAG: hypothetical protein JXR77_17870 [Lentisphaeria bacterium]|nr:hypothetical protein [Lentisphaeria bacterium]
MKAEVPVTNVYLITGDDEPMIEVEASRVLRRVAGEAADAFALDIVREREGVATVDLIREVLRSLKSPPFLGNRKTVWLHGFGAFAAEGTASTKTPEAEAFRELAGSIRAGIPSDLALVMDGPGASSESELVSACAAMGQVIVCGRPNLKKRGWQGAMRELLLRRAADKAMELPAAVVDVLVGALGADTGRIEGELEKLLCYVGGPGNPITRQDAEQICVGVGEEMSWALSDALGHRDAAEALRLVGVLLDGSRDIGKDVRALLGQTARYYRELLQAKIFMAERRFRSAFSVRGAVKAMSTAEKREWAERGIEMVQGNDYRAQVLTEQAEAYSGPELVRALRSLRDAYLRCVTSSVPERVAIEEVILRIAGMPVRKAGRRMRP